MDSNYREYNYEDSFARIDAILATPSGNFEETDNLPDRDKLTFTNGFYAYCTALFIDVRESSELPSFYTRPVLAKIYRAFISEMVAIFNSDLDAREINIVGDCVWGVYNTPRKSDIDDVFRLAYTANSLIKILNYKMRVCGYERELRVGVGMSVGRALMIKAGYSGSGIQDVVYMGDVVNNAAKLAGRGSNGWDVPPIFVDDLVYSNLNEHNQGFLRWAGYGPIYSGDIVDAEMEAWYVVHCT